jgi:hypothetical protein
VPLDRRAVVFCSIDGSLHPGANKKPEAKANAEKDRQVKRIALPPSVRTLLALDMPFEMVDEHLYLEVVKNCLNDCRELAKNNKLSDLTASIEAALKKCQKILLKEDTKKNKKEKEINDYELVELLKKVVLCHQPHFFRELEDVDVSKISNQAIRTRFEEHLNKRSAPAAAKKDDWEAEYANIYRAKYLKRE